MTGLDRRMLVVAVSSFISICGWLWGLAWLFPNWPNPGNDVAVIMWSLVHIVAILGTIIISIMIFGG